MLRKKTIRNTLKIQSLQKTVETNKTILIKIIANLSFPDIMKITYKKYPKELFFKKTVDHNKTK